MSANDDYSYQSGEAMGFGPIAALGHSVSVLRSLPGDARRAMLALLAAPLVIIAIVLILTRLPGGDGFSNEGAPSGRGNGLPAAPSAVPSDGGTDDGGTDGAGTELPSGDASPVESPDGASSSDPSAYANDQATAFDALLDQAAAGRRQVQSAVADLESCGANQGFAASVDALTQAADDRVTLADQVAGASVDQIGGDEAAQLLSAALRESAAADRAFAAWGSDLQEHCSTRSSTDMADYKRGVSLSKEAQRDKNEFMDVWNPIAARYGLSQRTADDI